MKSEKNQYLNVVFIGDSITAGALIADLVHDAPPVKAVRYLEEQSGVSVVGYSNRGENGCTTTDYLPGHVFFQHVVEAVDQFENGVLATLVFSMMQGTNDSVVKGPAVSPVSPAGYYTNMEVIISALLDLYPRCKIVLNRPVWYSPNACNGAEYMEEGLNRLKSYYFELQSLVLFYSNRFPGQVFMGDTGAFDYFKKNYRTDLFPERGSAGIYYLHPNSRGAAALGVFWGKAIRMALGDPV